MPSNRISAIPPLHSNCFRSLALVEKMDEEAVAVGQMNGPMVAHFGAKFILRWGHHISY